MLRLRHWAAIPVVLLCLLAAGCAYLAMSVVRVGGERRIDPSNVAVLLHRAGLTPDALAAAGLSDSEVEVVIAGMSLHSVNPTTNADLERATGELAAARRRAVTPPAPGQDVDGNSPVITPAAAQSQLSGLLDTAFQNATATLPEAKRQLLASIRANLDRGLPAPYLVRARSERAWLDLRNALAARRIAERNGTQLPERFRDTLLTVEAESEVGTAIFEHTARLQSVRNTWATALPASPFPTPGAPR